jgi:hypothetical protein
MRALTLIAFAAVLLSGCGSSSKPAGASANPYRTATATATATSTSPVTTATVPATTTTASTTASTTTPTAGLCRASGLRLSFLGQQGATGHGELGFALRNTTAVGCRTFGYPGIQFLSASGAPLPTASTRTTHDFFGSAPEEPLQIAPGESFSFRIGVTHFGAGGSSAGCTTAAALQVIPPNDMASLRISIPQGAYECGTATVSPVRPGSSAYP